MIGFLTLGIETSCDETACAILDGAKVLSERTTRQTLHEQYGGVVPELASRTHDKLLAAAVRGAVADAGTAIDNIDGIAVTIGPGLVGALHVGVSFAKGLSQALNVPWIGVNHIEAHLWSPELSHGPLPLPFLTLIVSGGHTLLIRVNSFGDYHQLGATRDDAAGELLDKAGRLLGLPFPAGAHVDRLAQGFQGESVSLPRAVLDDDPCSFSFSGVKTAVLYYLMERFPRRGDAFDVPDAVRAAVSAGLMESLSDMLLAGLAAALDSSEYKALVVAGGVSASAFLRPRIRSFAQSKSLPVFIPPIEHCTDNGAMIAHVGRRRLAMGGSSPLDQQVNPALELAIADM